MKRYFTIFCICLLSVISGFAADGDLTMETLAPAETRAFMRTAPLADVISSLNNFSDTSMTAEQKAEFFKGINDFKTKTGIDPMDEKSLRDAGIDTKRTAGFAMAGKNESQDMMIFLPVSDPVKFPLAFSGIIQKMEKEKGTGIKRTCIPSPLLTKISASTR
jgi:hypothetical protein